MIQIFCDVIACQAAAGRLAENLPGTGRVQLLNLAANTLAVSVNGGMAWITGLGQVVEVLRRQHAARAEDNA
jgi:hypothetical protein